MLEWVAWFDRRRLLEPIGDVPPSEFEAGYFDNEDTEEAAGLRGPSPR